MRALQNDGHGVFVTGNDCVIESVMSIGNGVDGYHDEGTDNRASGRAGDNSEDDVDTTAATNPTANFTTGATN